MNQTSEKEPQSPVSPVDSRDREPQFNDSRDLEKLSDDGTHNDEVLSHSSHKGREAVSRVEAINNVLADYRAFQLPIWFIVVPVNGILSLFSKKRIEKRSVRLPPLKFLLLFLLFLQGYSSGLDGIMSGSWQTYAGNFFGESAETGAINTVKAVIAGAVLVPYARLSDRFGRVETWLLAVLMFTVGRVVTAATPNFGGLFAGTIIWQFGYAGFRILATALTSDLSQLRDRDIVQHIIAKGDWYWRWGYGMFSIIVPVVTFVFALPYFFAQYKAKRAGTLPPIKLRKPGRNYKQAIWDWIMDLDIIGVLLFAGLLCLILIPLTIAGGLDSKWHKAYIIAMIAVGGGLIPVFLVWEWKFARAPFIPRRRLECTFYAAMFLEFCWRLAISVELNYVRLVLLVAFDQTPKSAQRLGQLYDFMQSCTNVVVGIILHFWPHPKIFVVAGSLIGLLGMGLMYKYRVAYDGVSGYIAADVLVGMGGGMMRFPMWTLVHAGIPHDQMAVATGFMMTTYQVGAAVGSCIGTAVWTQRLATKLVKELGPELGMQVYKSPLNYLKKYPLHTPQRNAILHAYSYIQRLLIIISISFAAIVVVTTLFIRNYTVGNKQSMTDEEREAERSRIRQQKHSWLKWIVGY